MCSTESVLFSLGKMSMKNLATKYWQQCCILTVLMIPKGFICTLMVLVEMWVLLNQNLQLTLYFFVLVLLISCNFTAENSLYLQLTPTLAIYDTMRSLKSPVSTHCVGFAYNLAAFLLAAGEKVMFAFIATESEVIAITLKFALITYSIVHLVKENVV